MSADTYAWAEALRLNARGESFVVATVIATEGSSPRNAGAKMIYRANGDQNGTVGGGQFEHLVLDAAAEHHRNRTSGIEHFVLGTDADQCCGGTMDVYFEYHGAQQRVVIFGAGHVAKEIADLLEPAPVSLTIVDDRPEWNNEERFPRAVRLLEWEEGVNAACSTPDATLACVMTCSHDTDFELLRSLLAVQTPAFVGLIGSKSKRACLFRRLVASGASKEEVERIHCPIGLGDMGKEPRLVAISICGQLLLEAKSLAVL